MAAVVRHHGAGATNTNTTTTRAARQAPQAGDIVVVKTPPVLPPARPVQGDQYLTCQLCCRCFVKLSCTLQRLALSLKLPAHE